MEISEFIEKIETEFEDIEPGSLRPESEFRKVMEWNSILALLMISLIDTEYDVTITADDLRNSVTVTDLFETVKSKL
jgi:acyl carrier protein